MTLILSYLPLWSGNPGFLLPLRFPQLRLTDSQSSLLCESMNPGTPSASGRWTPAKLPSSFSSHLPILKRSWDGLSGQRWLYFYNRIWGRGIKGWVVLGTEEKSFPERAAGSSWQRYRIFINIACFLLAALYPQMWVKFNLPHPLIDILYQETWVKNSSTGSQIMLWHSFYILLPGS